MQAGGHFDWRSLGKADYSQAAALVASLPADVRSEIKGVSDEILRRLVHLMWYRAEHSGRGRAYAYPSLGRLATWCSRSVRTVQRHVAQLIEAGLLATKERYRENGINMSSLYFPGPSLLASLFARKKRKSPMIRPTTKMSDNDLKREYKADVAPYVKPFVPPEWMMRRVVSSPTLTATERNDTAWDEDVTDPNAERKELLKQQAAALKARGL